MKPAPSKLAKRWGLQRPIIKSHAEKRWRGHGLGEFPKILGFPFNISATSEDSDFKFGTRLGFTKAHHKITAREKSGCGPGIGKLPKFLEFPFNIPPPEALAGSVEVSVRPDQTNSSLQRVNIGQNTQNNHGRHYIIVGSEEI